MKVLWAMIAVSVLVNLILGTLLVKSDSSSDEKSPISAEQASGIKDFKFEVDCNYVFDYKVCVSDFIGLSYADAKYKAQTHGLSPVIASQNGKNIFVYNNKEPFRINFDLDGDSIVRNAAFH